MDKDIKGIKTGDVLKAIRGSTTVRLTVSKVDEEGGIATVDGLDGLNGLNSLDDLDASSNNGSDGIFVYGTLVHDFNVVSLQPIIALVVAAITSD